MPNFQFTYTRCTPHGRILEHTVDTISAHTIKSAKHALVKRFGLQNGSPWRQTANGFMKTHTAYAYRGKIIISEDRSEDRNVGSGGR
ncbi:MAG: hypothetical protein OXU51_07750 [Candidatus Poribacteria bacterium]|nr:hypothetical protein [Candidatus Poribacteria bacterium]